MKIWILLLIAGLLLVWSLSREGFEPTETIKAPPYDDAEHARIVNMISSTDMKTFKQFLKDDAAARTPPLPVPTEEQMREKIGRSSGMHIATIYTLLYKPATSPLTEEQINQYIDRTPPTPVGWDNLKPVLKRLAKSYFIDQRPAIPSTGGASTTTGTTAGGTTGGSSTTSAAPNTGGSGKGQLVYGPQYTSVGTPIDMSGGNPGGDSKYPELWGGRGDCTSVRTAAGIQGPSQSWLLSQSGALPSTASLGCDANSSYLPYSRVPGDQDLIPDPYRLSRNYSTASYSNKTDPVPFLTDFSAFQK